MRIRHDITGSSPSGCQMDGKEYLGILGIPLNGFKQKPVGMEGCFVEVTSV